MADALYCSSDDVAARLSEAAVELRTDDISSIGDCIDEASAEIEVWIGSKIKPGALTGNRWAKYCCRSLACEYLCIRRGQDVPNSIAGDCERYREQLKQIAAGVIKLPNVPTSPGGIGVSNQRYDGNRYPALVTERPRSTPLAKTPARRFDPGADAAQGYSG